MVKKTFEVIYKFGDVIREVEAEDEEEAKRIADKRLLGEGNPKEDTCCYEIEVEELK